MEKHLGQEPAFPKETEYQEGKLIIGSEGISKRFYAACAAMQGMLANGWSRDGEHLIGEAYLFADELLKQENK